MQTVPQLASFGPFGGYYLFEMIIYGNVGGVTQPWSCLSSVYFHATATARVSLSDGSSIDVTRQSSLATSSSDVVHLFSSSTTRMQAHSAGTATISAQFGSQTTESAALEAQDSVLDSPTALAWSVYPRWTRTT